MTVALHQIAAFTGQPSDFTRAQILIQGHIAQIDAALSALRSAKARLLPSIADGLEGQLVRLRGCLIRDLNSILAGPEGACAYIGKWNHNGRGPSVMDACEAVDRSIARAPETMAYRNMIAARRRGLAVVS